jgi:hypothetical protein
VNPVNATVAGGPWQGTITDNDTQPTVSVSDCSLVEGHTGAAPCVTTVAQTASGSLRVFPAGLATPATSNINFAAGRVRANNTTVLLGAAGQATVQNDMVTGQTHVIVDVFGYYSVIEASSGSRDRAVVEPSTAAPKASEDRR